MFEYIAYDCRLVGLIHPECKMERFCTDRMTYEEKSLV